MLNLRRLKSLLAVLCAASFLSQQAQAVAIAVTNTADSGANSLRAAVTAAVAGDTIQWGVGAGGTIVLLTDLPAVGDKTTLDVSSVVSSMTIAAGNMSLAGGVTFQNTNAALDWAIATNIIGVGSMTKTGAGTLVLTGANSYAAGTFLNAGTLNINAASSLGTGALTFDNGKLQTASTIAFANAITFAVGGGTIDTLGNNSIFSGVISGVGSLTNASTGTLTLTGVNTYTGGTILSNGGILNINSDAALGGTGGLIFSVSGGTLQVAANMTSARAITLTGNGTFDTNGYNLLLSTGIDGPGALTKIGDGILTLTPTVANTYTGATWVKAGTLRLGADSALSATSALHVANGGTLDLSTYQTTVASLDLVSGGTLKTTVIGSNLSSKLIVAGNRDVTGGTLVVTVPSSQLIKDGDTFTVIQSGSKTGTGFANIVSPAALLFTENNTVTDVILTANFVPFANSAATGNQGALGRSLEAMRTGPTGDAAAVISNLYSLDAGQLRAALDQMSPVSLASMQGVGLASSGLQSAAVGQRIAVLADGGDHPGFSSYNVSGRSSYPGTLVATTLGDDNLYPSASNSSGLGAPWGYFASGSVTTGRLTEGNSDSGSQPGYAFNSGGLTMGADYRVDEHFTAGGSLGYLKGHASVYAPGSGTVDDDSVRFGGYGAANAGNLHANAYLGGALDFFKTKRNIQIPGLERTAAGSPLGSELNVNTNVSYDVPTREWGIYSPFAGLSYNRMAIGSFTESGAGALNLTVSPQTAKSLQSTLGLRLSQKWTTDAHVLVPYVSLGWRHEFDDQSRPITARFATGVGDPFTVNSGRYARDGTMAGLGLSATLSKNATARLDYTGDFRSHFVSTIVNADLRLRF